MSYYHEYVSIVPRLTYYIKVYLQGIARSYYLFIVESLVESKIMIVEFSSY